jgi:hypothetical protein
VTGAPDARGFSWLRVVGWGGAPEVAAATEAREPWVNNNSAKSKIPVGAPCCPAKVEGKEVVAAAPEVHKAPVIDIMEALKASLAQAKKPVASAAGDGGEKTRKPRKSSAGD